MAFQYASEPLDIGQVLDQGLKLFRHCFKSLLPLIILVMGVTFLSSMSSGAVINSADFSVEDLTAGFFGTMLVFTLVLVFLYMVMIFHCVSIANHENRSLADSFLPALKKIVPMILIYILYTIAIIVGLILLLIPGLILMITLMFGFYAMIIEDTGPIKSLRRSHFLVWGNFWRTTVVITVAGLLMIALYLALGLTAGLFGAFGDPDTIILTTNILSALTTPLLQPLIICIGLVLYHDLVLRKEGIDLGSAINDL
jgi:hypothetical protein